MNESFQARIMQTTLNMTRNIKNSKFYRNELSTMYRIGTEKNPKNIDIPLYGSNYVAIVIPNISTSPGPIIVIIALSVSPRSINIIKILVLVYTKHPYIFMRRSNVVNINSDAYIPLESPINPQIKAPNIATV